jgi:hypothetical protein
MKGVIKINSEKKIGLIGRLGFNQRAYGCNLEAKA